MVQAIATAPVRVQCNICGVVLTLEVPIEGLVEWRQGALIQDALPSLSLSKREMLITQTCGTCWDDLFKPEEEEEEVQDE